MSWVNQKSEWKLAMKQLSMKQVELHVAIGPVLLYSLASLMKNLNEVLRSPVN